MFAANVLAKAALPEHVPVLLRMLQEEARGQQHQAIEAFRRIRDKRSIQPMADLIASGSEASSEAADTLGDFGPIAEEAALKLLNEKHAETRRHACHILLKSGTPKSIEALQAIVAAGLPNLSPKAAEAIRAIQMRAEQAAQLRF